MITKAQAAELSKINKKRLEKEAKEAAILANKLKKEKKKEQARERKKRIADLVEYCEERIKSAAEDGMTECKINLGHPDNKPKDELDEAMSHLTEFNPVLETVSIECDNFAEVMAELTRIDRTWTEPRVNLNLSW